MLRGSVSVVASALVVVLGACVPEGPPTGGSATSKPAATHIPSMRAGNDASALLAAHAMLTAPFTDDFNREELGPNWLALSPHWRIAGGRLCAQGAHNKGAWLLRRIPVNARIELNAVAESPEGDIKVEAWGDGQTGARGASYTDATSYLAILGGWKNSRHVLARLDEHGQDRLEIEVVPNSDDERERPVSMGQPYHIRIERSDGKTVTWSVNGVTYLELTDEEPLAGTGHDHVGFNDWDAPVCFDNLKITPL